VQNEVGVHKLAHIFGLTFHMDTIYLTWLVMAIIILISFLATRRLTLVPTGAQNVLEMIVTAILDQIDSTMGPKGRRFAPLIITLFLFLLISNWLGLIPGLASPTNDLNTTLGLALLIIILVHITGVVHKGPKRYFKHFFEPYIPFVILNIIDEVAKPITLAFRLFGNIFAGEMLIAVLIALVPWWFPFFSIIWVSFSVFIGLIQAFVFTMLSMVYLGNHLREH